MNRTAARALAPVLLVGALAPGARADETTFCNAFVTSLPYTISAQGHYCFDRNLSTARASGNAITIEADFVVLDLNNFKLGGGAAGLATEATGVFAANRQNITIRNGNIRGFRHGILLQGGPRSAGHVIENNLLDGNTYRGIDAAGDTVVVRRNIVSHTGAGTAPGAVAVGIVAAGDAAFVHDNVVDGVGGASVAVGIYTTFVARDNAVANVDGTSDEIGIEGGYPSVCLLNILQNAGPLLCTTYAFDWGANAVN